MDSHEVFPDGLHEHFKSTTSELIHDSVTGAKLCGMEWIRRRGMETMNGLSQATRCQVMEAATGTHGPHVFYFAEHRRPQIALTIDDAPSRSASKFEELLVRRVPCQSLVSA